MSNQKWQDKCPTALYAWRFVRGNVTDKIKAEIKNRNGEIIKTFTEKFTNVDDGSYDRLRNKVYDFLETLPDIMWERGKQEIYYYDDYLMKDANVKF